jgi:hypothetical protein
MALNRLGRVEKWKEEREPLSKEDQIVYWMAYRLAKERELYHKDVMKYIEENFDDIDKFTKNENYGIKKRLITSVENATGSPTYWKKAENYADRKWTVTDLQW